MSRENKLSPYWQTVGTYLKDHISDPRLAMEFIKSHPKQNIQELAKSLGIEIPAKTTADTLDSIAHHAGTVGFTVLPVIATLAFALPLHGLHVPAIQFNYTDYAIYNGLCGINIAAMAARIKELDSMPTNLAQTEELENLKKKQAALKQQKTILWSMLSAIAAGIATYIVTSPDTKILSAAASTQAAGPAGIALGFIFVGIMTVLAALEIKQATAAEKRVQTLERSLEEAIKDYEDKTKAYRNSKDGVQRHQEALTNKKEAASRVNALTNLMYFEKAQAATHKTNSVLLGATATTLAGSAIAGTTFMVMAIVGATIAGGAVTMGALPLAFGLACAAIALYRWYRSIHPAEIKPVKDAGDTPMTSDEFKQEQKRTSNWAGLFNKPTLSTKLDNSNIKSDHKTETSARLRPHFSSPTK